MCSKYLFTSLKFWNDCFVAVKILIQSLKKSAVVFSQISLSFSSKPAEAQSRSNSRTPELVRDAWPNLDAYLFAWNSVKFLLCVLWVWGIRDQHSQYQAELCQGSCYPNRKFLVMLAVNFEVYRSIYTLNCSDSVVIHASCGECVSNQES